MKRSPIMLVATFGLFLGLQAYSTCLCGVGDRGRESACCQAQPAKGHSPNVKAPCCDRCVLRVADSIVLRESTFNDSIVSPFVTSHNDVEKPTLAAVGGTTPCDITRTPAVTLATCQPRAPPAA